MISSIVRVAGLAALTAVSVFAAEVPRRAPEFAFQLPGGKQELLSKYRGKVVVIEFLFTTCPHCQKSAGLLSRLQSDYGPKGFQALGVAFNDMSHMLVPDFVRDYKVTFPVGFSQREQVHSFLQNDPNHSLHVPQMVFVDRKGVIRHQSLSRGDEKTGSEAFLRQTIEKLLQEPGSAPARARAKKEAG
jgi:thiol-disulfide isomerase/thioredoxin